ncbi:MAG: hypothetical protein A3D74_04215 [Candidatus Levybacteria bacterium RIFCSPHIGHO2_02_FULL_37_13]|nr:MAG: hypothetical protein A3D74_04215 [Candidatus Levybacteria bacterium RIFCSPHIGHO2_02_FULL_37_13]OGH39755.1 MAG: hypothetical protein A3B41_04190 [Candidatus Levybacteria bacterium RIFCSPLOWO2_01_FULL_37_26]
MENTVKRRIDFENRLLDNGVSRFRHAFAWWKGRKLNKTTLLFLLTIFTVNLFITYPLFGRDVSASFSSSVFLLLAGILDNAHIMTKSQFFSVLTIFSITFAPISYYLFVRKTAMRHELIALVATMFYILPNPLTNGGSVLSEAILNGDGAHVFVFSFLPLFLLYVRAYISTGVKVWGFIAAIITAVVAVISPFATFNLLIIFGVITVSEGFFRDLREKISRLMFLLISSFLLSFFWYYPNILGEIVVLEHVSFAINKIVSILPLAIPIIPVAGLLLFLVFDRREKLKPVFLAVSFFLIYVTLYFISSDLNITGIFTSKRYLLELAFGSSYLLAMIFIVVIELMIRSYIPRIKNDVLLFLSILTCSALIFLFGAFAVVGVIKGQEHLAKQPIVNSYKSGIGNIGRAFSFKDGLSVVPVGISVLTFIFLLLYLKLGSASVVKAKEGE